MAKKTVKKSVQKMFVVSENYAALVSGIIGLTGALITLLVTALGLITLPVTLVAVGLALLIIAMGFIAFTIGLVVASTIHTKR